MNDKKPDSLTMQIRVAMDDSGFTRYRIAKDTGINESALSKFYHGERGLSINNLNLLFSYLELRVVRGVKPNRRTK